MPQQSEGLEALLNNCTLGESGLEETIRYIYGRRLPQLAISTELTDNAEKHNFQIAGYMINAQDEQLRRPRYSNY